MRRSFISRLSPREQRLVALLLLVGVVMGAGLLIQMRAARFSTTEASIEDMRRALELVYRQGSSYEELRAQKESREAKVSDEKLEFAYIVEEAEKKLEEVTARNPQEKPSKELEGGLRKRIYKLELPSITLQNLLTFLELLENQPGHVVRTDRLHIRSPGEVEDRLNVDVDLATWQMIHAAEPAEEEESP